MRKMIGLTILLIFAFSFCTVKKDNPETQQNPFNAPIQTDDGWEVSTPTAEGVKEGPLHQLIERINDSTYFNICSVVLVRHGKLIFEEYFLDFNRDTVVDTYSVTKSITSLLIGIAWDQGRFENVNRKLFSFFPEHAALNNEQKDKITLEHLLTMTSGLKWDESYADDDPRNDLTALIENGDWMAYMLAQPMVSEPGEVFHYNNGAVLLLSGILEDITGMHAEDYAKEHLFTPLGISDFNWSENPEDGMTCTFASLEMKARDMAKIGSLVLNNGSWKGNQVVSGDWASRSLAAHVFAPSKGIDYGYLWWVQTFNVQGVEVESVSARGMGGQLIFVFPSLDLAAVIQQADYDYDMRPLEECIIPAVL